MKLQEAIRTDNFRSEQHKATLNIMYTAYWLKTHVSAVMKEHGITTEQFNVMRILRGKHPEAMCIKDISSRMLEKSSNVPRIIDRLVAKKLVKRSTSREDKRETLIVLTETGLAQLSIVNEALEKRTPEILELSEDDAQKLNRILDDMRKLD